MRLPELVAGGDRDLGRDVGRLAARGPQPVATGVDEDPVEPRLEPRRVAQRRPLPPGLLERVVRRVLGVGRVVQDRAGQAVGGVEMVVGQAHESLGARCRRLDHGGPAVCHLDDLGRSVHDDMTVQRGQTFTTGFPTIAAGTTVRSARPGSSC